MNITKIKKLPYSQRIWKFTLNDRKYMYVTNRRRKYTEVYSIDDGEYLDYTIKKYLPLNDTDRAQGIRKFFALMMLQ